ncbi:DUF2529 family protein [Pseudalkalibacillus berkeleyi]|uniref:DUF2529 domain-containing protein n=1 Tax=Pseudalkalibacillus berkeleyi TaxID=1069813 RepID=A0ABS9H1S1_9BACL|nr:DUF2529 family protein [Pseudalkalibacillus berkeleyi]MCF6138932.1 DUF2529 domain-containing protein [Pseudalkalibacillus berkeleyi]
MLKIFTTQLFGVFRKIQEQEEDRIEDCGRLLAQTIIGDGTIYIKGFDEMDAIAGVIMNSNEKLPSIQRYHEKVELEPEDCLLIFARTADDERLQRLVEATHSCGTSVLTIGAVEEDQPSKNEEFHIDMKIIYGLVPDDEGKRVGYPPFMCALYVYYALFFTVSEMLEEYEIER